LSPDGSSLDVVSAPGNKPEWPTLKYNAGERREFRAAPTFVRAR
jgi:hypothetical protein